MRDIAAWRCSIVFHGGAELIHVHYYNEDSMPEITIVYCRAIFLTLFIRPCRAPRRKVSHIRKRKEDEKKRVMIF